MELGKTVHIGHRIRHIIKEIPGQRVPQKTQTVRIIVQIDLRVFLVDHDRCDPLLGIVFFPVLETRLFPQFFKSVESVPVPGDGFLKIPGQLLGPLQQFPAFMGIGHPPAAKNSHHLIAGQVVSILFMQDPGAARRPHVMIIADQGEDLILHHDLLFHIAAPLSLAEHSLVDPLQHFLYFFILYIDHGLPPTHL